MVFILSLSTPTKSAQLANKKQIPLILCSVQPHDFPPKPCGKMRILQLHWQKKGVRINQQQSHCDLF
jgi:hypothetical protein